MAFETLLGLCRRRPITYGSSRTHLPPTAGAVRDARQHRPVLVCPYRRDQNLALTKWLRFPQQFEEVAAPCHSLLAT